MLPDDCLLRRHSEPQPQSKQQSLELPATTVLTVMAGRLMGTPLAAMLAVGGVLAERTDTICCGSRRWHQATGVSTGIVRCACGGCMQPHAR